jgi:PAS domain S-box-containing protein
MPLIVIVALLIGTALLLWLLRCKLRRDREPVRLRQELAAESAHLHDAQNQLQLLFSANPYPMWVYDCATLRFTSVNDAALRTYGFSREEFLGMTALDIRPPEEEPTLLDYVNHIHLGLNSPGIRRHRKKDGSLLFVEVRGFAFERNGGSYELTLANDVTRRILMEEALRQSSVSSGFCSTRIVLNP